VGGVALPGEKLPCCKMVNKPLLTDRMRNDRLTFARRYAHCGVEQWKKVMFSDENHFQLTSSSRIHRPCAAQQLPSCQLQRMVSLLAESRNNLSQALSDHSHLYARQTKSFRLRMGKFRQMQGEGSLYQ
jgi:hypothetical protein